MTRKPQPTSHQIFAWDASALHHPIAADRVDVLLDLANNGLSPVIRHITTAAVGQELSGHGLTVPAAIDTVNVDGLDELIALARWVNLMSSSQHNRGEATVCAWAEVHQALVIMDDRDARRVARNAGLEVRGTLAVIADSIRNSHVPECTASALVDRLIDTGARYPHDRGDFIAWAEKSGLLPEDRGTAWPRDSADLPPDQSHDKPGPTGTDRHDPRSRADKRQ